MLQGQVHTAHTLTQALHTKSTKSLAKPELADPHVATRRSIVADPTERPAKDSHASSQGLSRSTNTAPPMPSGLLVASYMTLYVIL